MWYLLPIAFLMVLFPAGLLAEGTPAPAADVPPLVSIEEPPTYTFPQRRELDGYSLVLHAPQIETWPEFKSFSALIAIELTTPGDAEPSFGTARVTGATRLDMDRRIVIVDKPKISEVIFSGKSADEYEDVVAGMATRKELDIPLDLFLVQLADNVLSDPPPPGFNTTPPAIHVASTPTILLLVNGSPVLGDVEGSGLKVVVNANWPVFQAAAGKGPFYLLDKKLWLSAAKLDGKWKAASSLPVALSKLPDGDEYAAVKAAVPLKKSSQPIPKVIFTDHPAELIVTDGKIVLDTIPDTDGLKYVSNTKSPLFELDGSWYYLVAGRWFTTKSLTKGPWTYHPELPPTFEKIPKDHAMASVRASVPGTVEAKTAALEALLPTTTEVALDAKPPIEVTYAGEPKFEPIPNTQVSRAVNSGYDIIQYGSDYYLVYAGIWYVASAPIGPWTVTTTVPAPIYAIPPSSPAYNVTQVTVVESTPTKVVYSYPPAYSSSVYVVYGVPYYGTGWYYPPYIYGGYYYPYYGSYGHGSWYNPATGGYGSRSVWYGPYGGYSYTQGYNPSTGRYGYMETGWDNDEWASHSETYNSRTGVGTETSRYYDEDRNKSEMDRTVQRGDQWVQTQRETNWEEGTSQTQRKTSGGGESNMKRQYEDGTVSSSGTITTGDGKTFNVEGEQTRQGGSSTITGAQGSANLETQRNNGRSVTSIEGSGGGQGVSMSGQGPGRTTIGQSGSGDLYAGHNGNVYKKTDDGWQKREGGSWNSVDTPERPQGDSGRAQAGTTATSREGAGSISGNSRSISVSDYLSDYQKQIGQADAKLSAAATGQRQRDQMNTQRQGGSFSGNQRRSDMSRLDRDYSARQGGSAQARQRSAGMQRGGMSGMQRGGMRGGGGRRR